jgi:23S rRNA (pseudouridine1915-N3)-methyltransferase
MKCRLIAAGTRLPAWVDAGFTDYQKRLRAPLLLELVEIPVANRRAGDDLARAIGREGAQMMAALTPKDYVVALEVSARSMSTADMSTWLGERLRAARQLAFLISGPDGLAPACLERADQRLSLSPLTMPHALVRVVIAEQIYRAMSLLGGHPYHRA